MAGDSGIELTGKLLEAECCNETERAPNDCFINGLKEPRANFIFDRYFEKRMTHEKPIGHFGRQIVRTKEEMQHADVLGRRWGELHGKYRADVGQKQHPKQ